ncbi:MAG: sn-glycerol-3-phosphate ABC transporter ATP-binding protein UgpC [Chloroflexota bacterium]|nr:sn-glycerol-3-phosphate ABC transporter ATP-binding protein UgpC [Chloroflexota bacterium]
MAEVRFQNVTKLFGETMAVNKLNLEITDKEFLVLVGPSGCGKSTVLRLLSGLEEIDEGDIYIGGQLVNNVPSKDRNIAMVFQSYALYPHMSVYDNMAFGLSLRKVPKADIDRRVKEAANVLGIQDLLKRKPRQLSGGQRQRVALGRAIVREPAVFLLDEPLSNLDAKLRVQTRAELSKLHRRLGTTFIYVTHDQIEAMTMATRIAILDKGVLQQVGTPRELYDRPGNVFVAGFIGSPAMNFFEVTVGGNPDALLLDSGIFRVPVPTKRVAMLLPYLGRKVTFGIRPEDIHVSEYLPTGIDSSAVVPAKVDVIELMGNELFIYLASSKSQFLARVDPRAQAQPGQDMEVVFNMANLHAFDLETGKAI